MLSNLACLFVSASSANSTHLWPMCHLKRVGDGLGSEVGRKKSRWLAS